MTMQLISDAASMDVWRMVLAAVGILVSLLAIAVTMMLFWVGRISKRMENLGVLAENRAEAMVNLKFENFEEKVADLCQRLRDGDETFDQMHERNQKNELSFVSRMGELKSWMLEHFVTKQDLKVHGENAERRMQHIESHCDHCSGGDKR